MLKQRILDFLQAATPFTRLPGPELQQLSEVCSLRNYRAKEPIFFEGENGFFGYYVLSGSVSLIKTSPGGKSLLVALFPQGEPFGTLAVIENRPFPLTALAQSQTEILLMPKAELVRIWHSFPEIGRDFAGLVGERLRQSHNISRGLAHDRVEIRIASVLLSLRTRLMGNNSEKIRILRQELADLTGTTIETATRTSKKMEREGILDLTTPGVVEILLPGELQKIVAT